MKKLKIDFKIFPTKQKLFSFLITQIDGLYGENYDALIDALTFYKRPLEISLKNIIYYEDKAKLLEILEIIHKENILIHYYIR